MAETKAKKPAAAEKTAAPAKKAATAAKSPAAKAPVAKAAVKKAPAKKAASSKPAKQKKVVENGITITQIGSPIGREKSQEATLKGLGLNKLNRTRTLEDTPSVRGMIAKVAHMLKIDLK